MDEAGIPNSIGRGLTLNLSPEAVSLLNALASGALRHTQRDITPPTGPYMHGPGGLFNIPQAEQDVFSTRLVPTGLGSVLPAFGTLKTNPEYLYITGFRGATGTDPDEECDDAMEAGPIKNCLQTARFGIQQLSTRSVLINRVGEVTDRAEPMDFRLVNDPIIPMLGRMLSPEGANVSTERAIGNEVLMRFLEVGQEFQERLLPMVFTGNPANNSAGGGTKQYPGLNILIGTNKVDAETGQECPSLRSIIEPFDFGDVGDNSGTTIVDLFASIFFRLRHIASRTRMGNVEWAIVMREGLFREMTKVWPCSYMTSFCGMSNPQASVNVDAGDMVGMRDDMRNNHYLLVDGLRYRVIIDDSIVESTDISDPGDVDAGCFASDVYIVSLSVKGNYPTLYWEYKDYTRGAMIGAAQGRYAENTFWTDSGVFLWVKKPNENWCVQWQVKTEPRIILLTPHLCARITDVTYCPQAHERDSLKSQPYFVDGGATDRPGRRIYGDWATTVPLVVGS